MAKERSQSSANRVIIVLLAVLTAMVLVWFLQATYFVSMPLFFAFFMAATVRPVQDWLDRRLPARMHWVGTMAAMGTVLLALSLMVLLVYAVIATVIIHAPRYVEQLSADWQRLNHWLAGHGIEVRQEFLNSDRVLRLLTALVPVVWETLFLLVLVFLFAMMMLLEASQWTRKSDITLDHSMPVNEIVEDVARRVRKYLQSVTLVSVISGTAHGLFWLIMGVDLWYIWALLMIVMNYIPNIGTLLAFIPPLLVALVQHGPGWALLLLGGMSILETGLSYYMSPRIHGKGQSISPLVVIASILFWSWVWGIVGAFLAVPLTVMLVSFFQRTSLHSIALLLSIGDDDDEANHAAPPPPTDDLPGQGRE